MARTIRSLRSQRAIWSMVTPAITETTRRPSALTSKAGAAMVTESVHFEYGDQGIRAMGLSPGTVATQMQVEIRESGINPVSRKEWSEHIAPEWVAKLMIWMCGPQAADLGGQEISLKDPAIRAAIGVGP